MKSFEEIKNIEGVQQVEKTELYESFVFFEKGKSFLYKHFFDKEVMTEEFYRYKKLKKINVYVPRLFKVFKKDLVLVYQYISGENMAVILSKEDISEKVFEELFTQYRFCRQWKLDINYLPENFVFDGKTLYYTSLDLFNHDESISLDNYGIDYWFPTIKAKEHLEKLGLSIDKGRILKPAEAKKKIVLTSVLYW